MKWGTAALAQTGRQGHLVNRRHSQCVAWTATKLLNGLAMGKITAYHFKCYRPPTHHLPKICKAIGIELVSGGCNGRGGPITARK